MPPHTQNGNGRGSMNGQVGRRAIETLQKPTRGLQMATLLLAMDAISMKNMAMYKKNVKVLICTSMGWINFNCKIGVRYVLNIWIIKISQSILT